MVATTEQVIDQDYFAGADISAILAHAERQISTFDIDVEAITTKALLDLQREFPTVCYKEPYAVVICDCDMDDLPIVYVSSAFKHLTGYHPSEVVGHNCRFLQRPNYLTPGRVVGPLPAYNGFDPKQSLLRQKIHQRKAAYVTIINYHKSGQAFLNGLSVIPVDFNGSRYYVGFQTDISSQHDMSRRSESLGISSVTQHLSYSGQISASSASSSLDSTSDRPCPVLNSADLACRTSSISTSCNFETPSTSDGFEALISMLSAMPGYMIFVISPFGRTYFVSKNVEQMLGFSPDHLYSCSFFDIIHSQDVGAFRAELRKLAPGTSCEMICRISTMNGTAIYMDFRSSRVSSNTKPASYIVVSAKQISSAVVLGRHFTSETTDKHPVLWAKISISGLILYGTSALRSLFHAPSPSGEASEAAAVTGLTFQSRLCPQSRKVFEDALANIGKGSPESIKFRHCFQRPAGNRIAMMSNLLLAESDSGNIVKVRPSFVLIQTQYLNNDDQSAHSKRRVKHPKDTSLDRPCDHSCIAASEPQPRWPLMQSNSTIQWQYQPPHEGATFIDRLLPTRPVIREHDTASSDMFGFDPPSIPEPGATSISLLPLDLNVCWQYIVHSVALANQAMKKELNDIIANLRVYKRRRRAKKRNQICANCGTTDTPEWRKGPSGKRDLCNRCGLRYAKRISRQVR